jgi:hypothetical protein
LSMLSILPPNPEACFVGWCLSRAEDAENDGTLPSPTRTRLQNVSLGIVFVILDTLIRLWVASASPGCAQHASPGSPGRILHTLTGQSFSTRSAQRTDCPSFAARASGRASSTARSPRLSTTPLPCESFRQQGMPIAFFGLRPITICDFSRSSTRPALPPS